MKKQKVPEMFADSDQEEDEELKEFKELKNWARLELVKTEKDRTKLNQAIVALSYVFWENIIFAEEFKRSIKDSVQRDFKQSK